MSKANIAQKSPIQLSVTDADRQVIITPEEEDRFSLTCMQAVEACKLHINRKVWFDDLATLFGFIRAWVEAHKDLVSACYAAPQPRQVVFFFVPASASFDFRLADLLAELSLEISEKFQLIPAEVLQIPGKDDDQLQTFLNKKVAKALHVQGN